MIVQVCILIPKKTLKKLSETISWEFNSDLDLAAPGSSESHGPLRFLQPVLQDILQTLKHVTRCSLLANRKLSDASECRVLSGGLEFGLIATIAELENKDIQSL